MSGRPWRVRWDVIGLWLAILAFCVVAWWASLRAWVAFVKWCVRQP